MSCRQCNAVCAQSCNAATRSARCTSISGPRSTPPVPWHVCVPWLWSCLLLAARRLDQAELSKLGVHQLRRFLEALLQVRWGCCEAALHKPLPRHPPARRQPGRCSGSSASLPSLKYHSITLRPARRLVVFRSVAAPLPGQRPCHRAVAGARAPCCRGPPHGQQEGAG